MTAGKLTERKFQCKLLLGDTKEVLKDCPDNTFHCAVTSPPYWDQRDYKVEGQLGQESTPEEYVEAMVALCGEIRRVLRKDGTFWLNIGDGYCKKALPQSGLKPKDLIGTPWMLASALRKDGWYLRSDIIWQKTNPMPDSAKDRPAKSYEHLFLFSKTPKYFFDWWAIKEPQEEISIRRAFSKNRVINRKDFGDNNYAISGASQDKTYEKMRERIKAGEKMFRNKRDVWKLPTADNWEFKHFAIYPELLVRPCILSGTSSHGCCPKCKAPWIRKKKPEKWKPSCNCKIKDVQECLVLDPFNGSGTTGRVCMDLHRKYVGVDISEKYIDEARQYFVEKDLSYKEVVTLNDLIK